MELNKILTILNICEDDIQCWYKGLKYVSKNRYFKSNDTMVVQLTRNLFTMVDNTRKVRDIFKKCCFNANKYPMSRDCNDKQVYYHQLFKDYDSSKFDCDHINNNPFDNRALNLRIVSHRTNMRNKKKQHNNTSGTSGVRYEPRYSGSWLARIVNNDNVRISKSYSCGKYDDAKKRAILWRRNKEVEFGYLQ
jgi:hypothetical protein